MQLDRGDKIKAVNPEGIHNYHLRQTLDNKWWEITDRDGTSGLYTLKSGKRAIMLIAREIDELTIIPEFPDFQTYIKVKKGEEKEGYLW